MTKTIFFVACILCTHSMLAQMSITQPGVGNDLDPADYVGSQNKAINIDIDGDGAMDFMVFDSDQNDLSVDAFGVDDIGGTNGVNSIPFPLNPAAPLELVTLGAANDVIGSGDTFNNVKDQLLYVFAAGVGGDAGEFLPNTNNGYIGVEFVISGVVHYGFITVSFTDHATWNIDGWGYNATAGADAGFTTLSIGKNQFSDNVRVYSYDNSITIKNLPEAADYTLYSIMGQVVQQGTAQRNDANFSVSSLAHGIYVLKAVGKESGKLLTAKLLF